MSRFGRLGYRSMSINGRSNSRKTKNAGNGWNLLDLANTWPNLARFLKELTRSRRDLEEILLNLNGSIEILTRSRWISTDLLRNNWKFLILAKISECFWYIGSWISWNWILKSRLVNRPLGLDFWRLRLATDHHQCQVFQF